MVVSRKQMTPKPSMTGQAGGSRKRFSSCGSNSGTRKTDQAGGSRKSKHSDKKAWCMRCEKKVDMIDAREVTMKRKGGKTGKRLAGTDASGHKVSLIVSSKD